MRLRLFIIAICIFVLTGQMMFAKEAFVTSYVKGDNTLTFFNTNLSKSQIKKEFTVGFQLAKSDVGSDGIGIITALNIQGVLQEGIVLVVNTKKESVKLKPIFLKPPQNGAIPEPYAISIRPDNRYAFVTDLANNVVYVLKRTGKLSWKQKQIIPVGQFPEGIKATNSLGYVSNANDNSLTIFSTHPPFRIIANINLAANGILGPNDIATTPDNKFIVLTGNNSNNVCTINAKPPFTVHGPFDATPGATLTSGVAVVKNAAAKEVQAFVTCYGPQNETTGIVSVFRVEDTGNLTLIQSIIDLPPNPAFITANGNKELWVTNANVSHHLPPKQSTSVVTKIKVGFPNEVTEQLTFDLPGTWQVGFARNKKVH